MTRDYPAWQPFRTFIEWCSPVSVFLRFVLITYLQIGIVHWITMTKIDAQTLGQKAIIGQAAIVDVVWWMIPLLTFLFIVYNWRYWKDDKHAREYSALYSH